MNRYRKLNHALFHHKQISLTVFAAVLALAAYPAWRVWAAGGNLDTSFSGDGKFTLNYGYGGGVHSWASVNDILIQSDPNNPLVERVIVAYSNTNEVAYLNSGDSDLQVTRLTASGTKDNTFGTSGVAAISFDGTGLPQRTGTVTALALQSNNKILVAGTLNIGGGYGVNVAALARLTADGALDTTFSGDGLWVFLGGSEVSDLIVQPDGKILLTGRMRDSTNTYWKSALWRFNSNGTPDTSFGTSGYLHTTVWSGSSTDGGVREGFKSVYVQSDGKIVVLNNNGSGYRLRRFTANGGALDFTLQVNAATGDKGNSIRAVGSNIWVVGSTGDYGAIFAHNSTSGSPDASFGNSGKAIASQPSVWTDSAPMPFSFPAKYVIAGWNKYVGNCTCWPSKAVITRYSNTGELDTSFGTNGSTETADFDNPFSPTLPGTLPHSRFFAVKVGLSGKIVASGVIGNFVLPSMEYGGVARYWGN